MILICHIVLILLITQHTDINQYVSGEKILSKLQTDMFKQRRSKAVPVPKSTQAVVVDD